jgi:hypothetical protein
MALDSSCLVCLRALGLDMTLGHLAWIACGLISVTLVCVLWCSFCSAVPVAIHTSSGHDLPRRGWPGSGSCCRSAWCVVSIETPFLSPSPSRLFLSTFPPPPFLSGAGACCMIVESRRRRAADISAFSGPRDNRVKVKDPCYDQLCNLPGNLLQGLQWRHGTAPTHLWGCQIVVQSLEMAASTLGQFGLAARRLLSLVLHLTPSG